jgi:hypothetical protein
VTVAGFEHAFTYPKVTELPRRAVSDEFVALPAGGAAVAAWGGAADVAGPKEVGGPSEIAGIAPAGGPGVEPLCERI